MAGTSKGNNETLREGIEAGLHVAFNYDGAQMLQEFHKVLKEHKYDILRHEDAQDIWDKINGKL